MARRALTLLDAWFGSRHLTTGGHHPRRSRRCLNPGTEVLELRDCPSTLAASLGFDRSAHALVVIDHVGHQERHSNPRLHHESETAIPFKKAAKGASTIYVAPSGKLGAAAGKNAAHPLGSLTVAIKRAKPGSTIKLAPGV